MRWAAIGVAAVIGIGAAGAAGFVGGRASKTPQTTTELQTTTQTVVSTSTAEVTLGHTSDASCVVSVSNQAAEIYFYNASRSQAQGLCDRWISAATGNSTLWIPGRSASGSDDTAVCTLADNTFGASVLDDGGQTIGTQVCAGMVQQGWVETQQIGAAP